MKNFTFLFCSILPWYLTAQTIHVDQTASGSNDGTTWINAYTSVQTAVNNANAGDTILIAQGIYREGTEIQITNSLIIRGGYPHGGGAQNVQANETVLDGKHRHRVIRSTHITDTLYMEGLTIKNGNVHGTNNASRGAGIYTSGPLHAKACHITNNVATGELHAQGGGIRGTAIILTNCKITCNRAVVDGNSQAVAEGGGIFGFPLTLINCQISGNRAIASKAIGNTTVEAHGGGIYCSTFASLTNCQVSHNMACSLNSSFSGSAFASGGGILGLSITMTNTQVNHNIAVANSTTPGSSIAAAGGIYGTTVLNNSVLWGNTIVEYGTSTANEHLNGTLTANHSVIKAQNPSGTGNIDATVANFETDNFIDAANGNLGPTPTSVLINAGNNTYLPADTYDVDNDGNATETIPLSLSGFNRTVGSSVDIGVLESNFSGKNYNTSANAYFFDENNSAATQDGLSWATAFSRLDDYFHIQNTSNLDSIYLAKGKYPISGTLIFSSDINIVGGYNATTGAVEPFARSALDVQHNGRVILAQQNLDLTSTNVMNGLLTTVGALFGSYGGGIYCPTGSTTLTKCQVSGNQVLHYNDNNNVQVYGGGIYGQTINLTNSRVNCNAAVGIYRLSTVSVYGGGIYGTSINMTNSQITDNIARGFGLDDNGSASTMYGGGVYTNGSGLATLTNSQVNDNTVFIPPFTSPSMGGGGIWGTTTLNNSVLWGNTKIVNGMSVPNEHQPNFAGSLTVSHSVVKNQNPSGISNINATSPNFDANNFVNAPHGNFELTSTSVLRNAGNISYLPADTFDLDMDDDTIELLPIDFNGMPRLNQCEVDIGIYEQQAPWGTSIADTAQCDDGQALTLNGIGNSLQWHSDNGLSNLLGQGNLFNTGILPVGNTTYYTSDSAFNCPRHLVDSVTVTIYDLPILDLGQDTTYCFGDSVLLDAGTGFNYSWNTMANSQSIYVTQGTYHVLVTDANNCQNNDTILITENALPSLNLGLDTAYCEGDSVLLDAGSGFMYDWNTTETSQTIYATQGTYDVTITDGNNCENSDAIVITEHSLPTVNLGADTTLCDTATLFMLDAGGGMINYLWNTADITQTINVNGSALGTGAHEFNVLVTDMNGCQNSDTINIVVESCNSLGQTDILPVELKVYPNPTSDYFVIEVMGLIEASPIQLLDAGGKVVWSGTLSSPDPQQVSVENFSSGLYYLKLEKTTIQLIKN